jgi:hypothetical protein
MVVLDGDILFEEFYDDAFHFGGSDLSENRWLKEKEKQ